MFFHENVGHRECLRMGNSNGQDVFMASVKLRFCAAIVLIPLQVLEAEWDHSNHLVLVTKGRDLFFMFHWHPEETSMNNIIWRLQGYESLMINV